MKIRIKPVIDFLLVNLASFSMGYLGSARSERLLKMIRDIERVRTPFEDDSDIERAPPEKSN